MAGYNRANSDGTEQPEPMSVAEYDEMIERHAPIVNTTVH